MALIQFLTSTGNVPYAIALGIALVFFLLQATGLLGFLAGEADGGDDAHDLDGADHDADGGEHGADHDTDADADHDRESEAPHGARSLPARAFAPLGFGKIPFSMIWQTLAVVFGATGFGLNARYIGTGSAPASSLLWTLPVSFASGYLAVAVLAKLLGPLFSPKEQEATSRGELVGQIGVVISTKVDADFGEVRIRDRSGHNVRVVCRLASEVLAPVMLGESVVIAESSNEGIRVTPLEPRDASFL